MLTTVHKYIAAEPTLQERYNQLGSQVLARLQANNMFMGRQRIYHPLEDQESQKPLSGPLSPEIQEIVTTPELELNSLWKVIGPLYDVILAKEEGNTQCTADLVVDEVTILQQVPVGVLLGLERMIDTLTTYYKKVPFLPPQKNWSIREDTRFYYSKERQTDRTVQRPMSRIAAPATENHPAQLDVWQEQVLVGHYREQEFSSAWPHTKYSAMLEKLAKLKAGIRTAIREANSKEVDIELRYVKGIQAYLES